MLALSALFQAHKEPFVGFSPLCSQRKEVFAFKTWRHILMMPPRFTLLEQATEFTFPRFWPRSISVLAATSEGVPVISFYFNQQKILQGIIYLNISESSFNVAMSNFFFGSSNIYRNFEASKKNISLLPVCLKRKILF